MVVTVVAPAPSTATTKKKNRRKEKKAPRRAEENVDDTEMDVAEGPSSLSGSGATEEKPASPPTDEGMEDNFDDDDVIIIDTEGAGLQDGTTTTTMPSFPPLSESAQQTSLAKKSETRRIPIPPHRMTPLKKDWVSVFGPLTELLGLQVRMNVQRRCVEIRTSRQTKEIGALQKGADFVKAYALGFDINDSIALLRLDDLYLDSFEIKDVKSLQGDHLSRAIGRIAGQDGKTKFTIENASRTRIVLADTKIHILGSFQNIKIARDAICSLILGSPPGKVYAGLRTVASRMRQRSL